MAAAEVRSALGIDLDDARNAEVIARRGAFVYMDGARFGIWLSNGGNGDAGHGQQPEYANTQFCYPHLSRRVV